MDNNPANPLPAMEDSLPAFLITVYSNGLTFGLYGFRFPTFFSSWEDLLKTVPLADSLIPILIHAEPDTVYLPR